MIRTFEIYTDGACKSNKNGGWGYHCLLYRKEHPAINFEDFGGAINTTNQRMELSAMLECMKFLNTFKSVSNITIYSDSKYTINGLVSEDEKYRSTDGSPSGWLKLWKRNNYKTASNKPVLNLELWLELEKQYTTLFKKSKGILAIEWVEGHSKNEGNDRADTLANKGCGNI